MQCRGAQATEENTQGKLDASNAELTDAERALATVDEQLKALQAVLPTGTAAAVSKPTGARSNARGRAKRATVHGESNSHLSSPQDQRKSHDAALLTCLKESCSSVNDPFMQR